MSMVTFVVILKFSNYNLIIWPINYDRWLLYIGFILSEVCCFNIFTGLFIMLVNLIITFLKTSRITHVITPSSNFSYGYIE